MGNFELLTFCWIPTWGEECIMSSPTMAWADFINHQLWDVPLCFTHSCRQPSVDQIPQFIVHSSWWSRLSTLSHRGSYILTAYILAAFSGFCTLLVLLSFLGWKQFLGYSPARHSFFFRVFSTWQTLHPFHVVALK